MKTLRFVYEDDKLIEKALAFNLKYDKFLNDKKLFDQFLIDNEKSQNKWNEFKGDFLSHTARCPICENILNKFDDIDHYRPKSHYWWLTYNFYNYILICDLCNRTYKKTNFPLEDETKKVSFDTRDSMREEVPLLFNPLHDSPLDLFELEFCISRLGEIMKINPRSSLSKKSSEYMKAQVTIDLFKLNDEVDDPQRKLLLKNHFSLLKNLVEKRHKYLSNKIYKDDYKKELNLVINENQLGLGVFILKGQYKWLIP